MDDLFEPWRRARSNNIAAALETLTKEIRNDDLPLIPVLSRLLTRGGKKYRPLLTLAVAESLGVVPDADAHGVACRLGASLECFHAASLVYDDLPAMDNAACRRDAPALHRELDASAPGRGVGLAMLCAHSLVALGFRAIAYSGLSPVATPLAVAEAADAVGFARMAGGQALDLMGYPGLSAADPSAAARERWLEITTRKTSALFAAAAHAGALAAFDVTPTLSDAAHAELDRARNTGLLVGQAYQLADDLRDRDEDARNHTRTLATESATEVPMLLRQCLDRASELAGSLPCLHPSDSSPRPLTSYLAWMRTQCGC